MIRTFLFDLGNVLVHFSHDLMCEQIGELCDRSSAEIHRLLLDSELQWDFERGKVSPEQLHAELQRQVGRELDFPRLREAATDIFTLNEPMVGILAQLKSAGHRLVVLSNTSPLHFEYIQNRFSVLEPFDDFVLSYRVGALKPEAEIYQAALNAIQCAPEECLYTDDIPQYVETARTFGLQAEVFTDADSFTRVLAARGVVL